MIASWDGGTKRFLTGPGNSFTRLGRWLPDGPMILVGDGAYSSTELGLTCAKWRVTLIAPLRPDACLYAPLPPHPPRREGRPRVVGERLPRRDDILADPNTQWHSATVNCYGEGKRETRVVQRQRLVESLPCWPCPFPLRWVISRDPTGQRETRFSFATDPMLSGLDSVLAFMSR